MSLLLMLCHGLPNTAFKSQNLASQGLKNAFYYGRIFCQSLLSIWLSIFRSKIIYNLQKWRVCLIKAVQVLTVPSGDDSRYLGRTISKGHHRLNSRLILVRNKNFNTVWRN